MGLSGARVCLEAGARIVAVGLDEDSVEIAQKDLGGDATVFRGDAADAETAVRAIDMALDRHGAFDGLYHVAGGSGRKHGDGPLHDATDEGWRYTIELNQTSVFYSNRAAVRAFLKEGRPGSVLNMASALALAPSPNYFDTYAYTTAKAAIVGMTRMAAAEYAAHDIRFNAVAPGLVDTPMSKRAQDDEATMAYVRKKQPLDGGRMGQPEDLDAAVVYLLSDASRFVTGQVLAIDGGWTASESVE